MSAVKDVALVPAESVALSPHNQVALVLERYVTDPTVDVNKLEKLIELQERMLKHQAKADFDAAFAEMQGKLQVVLKRGRVIVDGVLRNTYAKNEDIVRMVRPVLAEHGFSLRHRHETDGKTIKVIGILSHRNGHSEQDEFVSAPDDGGKMNSIQRIGSARAYGQRYTTVALLNIATEDDDGQGAGRPDGPQGYDDWFKDLTATADNGAPALTKAWNDSKPEFKNHVMKHDRDRWNEAKRKAQAVRA